jgi:hypothetical protein
MLTTKHLALTLAVIATALASPVAVDARGGPLIAGTLTFVNCLGQRLPVSAEVTAGRWTTHAVGTFELRVSPGTYDVVATSRSYPLPRIRRAVVVRHERTEVDFVYWLACSNPKEDLR